MQCHTLPDGSSNTSSLTTLIPGTVGNVTQLHPVETAATRNLFQREALLHRDFKIPEISRMIFTGNFGLLHTGQFSPGLNLSINDFIGNVFIGQMPGPDPEDRLRQVEAVIAFMRQFDTGIAPLVGFSFTYFPGSPVNRGLLWVLEEQVAQANTGLGVYTRSNGVEKGYYYDLTVSPPRYREEGTSNLISADDLDRIAATNDGVVILQVTPLGSERRWANLEGIATPIKQKNLRPENVTLERMAPSVPWVDVTKSTGNLEPTPPAISLQGLRALQDAVIGPQFGVPFLRHEPPRRFRVSGRNIRPGARLAIAMRSDGFTEPDAIVTDPDVMITDPTSIAIIWMPLFPTRFVSGGMPVWETEAEADATITMALLNGGLWAPGVAEILLGTVPPNRPLDPETWNSFLVGVLNEDDTLNRDLEWQVLRVQAGR